MAGLLAQAATPYNGPFPDVPVLMLNGDIDLQTPLEMAEQAKTNWPNSVFLTIKDATHVLAESRSPGCPAHPARFAPILGLGDKRG
jgi:pimeloyl-ACP methyl ester carboxylesterase